MPYTWEVFRKPFWRSPCVRATARRLVGAARVAVETGKVLCLGMGTAVKDPKSSPLQARWTEIPNCQSTLVSRLGYFAPLKPKLEFYCLHLYFGLISFCAQTLAFP